MSRDIPTNLIDRDPDQPRQYFDPDALAELAQSIGATGLAVPILLRPAGERFIIVHGERRYRAVCSLGWATIPADVRDIAPDAAQWLALVENVQRSDLSPIEEARAYQARLAGGMTQEALGQKIGKTQSYIAQKLRLLTLPDPVLVLLDRKAITEGHARQLLRLKAMYHDMTMTFNDTTDGEPLTGERFRPVLDDAGEQESFVLGMLFNQCRIEDQPAGLLLPKSDSDRSVLRQAILSYFDYIAQNANTIPLWAVGAFYWGAIAACAHWGVALLSKQIDLWHDRFLSAIYWKAVCQGDMKYERDIEQRSGDAPIPLESRPIAYQMQWYEYWGFMSDLRHGGVTGYLKDHEMPRDLLWEAIEHIKPRGFRYSLPTQIQPYGPHHERYFELQAQWEAMNPD